MHDRTIDGKVLVFGNAGGLYKNAMTWWDHGTSSIWSQPVGEALSGPMKGSQLQPLPFQLTTWENWLSAHPNTLVMAAAEDSGGGYRQGFNEQFVIGVLVADLARGYPYQVVSSRTLVEDQLGDFPIMVWAKDEDYRVFLRVVGNQELHFVWEEGSLADLETGSLWNPQLGIAKEGEYKGCNGPQNLDTFIGQVKV